MGNISLFFFCASVRQNISCLFSIFPDVRVLALITEVYSLSRRTSKCTSLGDCRDSSVLAL